MEHVVYCDNKEKVLEKILDGTKTMIIRSAAGRKIPHSRVFIGENLYFIEKGSGTINVRAIVKNVDNFVKLTEEEIKLTIDKNNDKLQLSQKQIIRWSKKCICLIEFEKVEKIVPMKLDHQTNMDDWLIVENVEDVVEGTSKKYDYANSKLK